MWFISDSTGAAYACRIYGYYWSERAAEEAYEAWEYLHPNRRLKLWLVIQE